jgi:ABC-type enterobactin transport system permease subunit
VHFFERKYTLGTEAKTMVQKTTRSIVVNWKTSIAGIVAFLSVASPQIQLLFDGNEGTNPDWNIVVGAFSILVAALFARDAGVSTEESRGASA